MLPPGADRRRRDRRLPAHRDPRRRLRQPRGGRRAGARPGPLDLVLVESGGDNLTAIFSPALADVQIFVIDVAGGDDIPRKGGPGIVRSRPARDQQGGSRRARRLRPRADADATPRQARRRGRCSSCRSRLDPPARARRRVGARAGRRASAPASSPRRRSRTTMATTTSPPPATTSSHAGRLRLARRAPRRPVGRQRRPTATSRTPHASSRAARAGRGSCSSRRSPGRSPATGSRSSVDVAAGRRARARARTPPRSPTRRRRRAPPRLRCASPGRGSPGSPQPLILAAGCDLDASLELELAPGAAAVTRELVVLGRHGEEPGRYRSRLRAELAGAPLLHDEVHLPAGGRRSTSTAPAPTARSRCSASNLSRRIPRSSTSSAPAGCSAPSPPTPRRRTPASLTPSHVARAGRRAGVGGRTPARAPGWGLLNDYAAS